jgi:hypothetical protein
VGNEGAFIICLQYRKDAAEVRNV